MTWSAKRQRARNRRRVFCDGRYGSGHRLNGKRWGGKRSQVALPPCISEVQSMLNAGTLQMVPLGAVQEGIDAASGLGGERGSFLDVLKITQIPCGGPWARPFVSSRMTYKICNQGREWACWVMADRWGILIEVQYILLWILFRICCSDTKKLDVCSAL